MAFDSKSEPPPPKFFRVQTRPISERLVIARRPRRSRRRPSHVPLGDTPQDGGEPIVSLASSWPGCGQGAASLHHKRGRHGTHDGTFHHRSTCDQAGKKTAAITISCTCCVQNVHAKSRHVKDGGVRPFADKRTVSSQFYCDASVVGRRLFLYPIAQIDRVPNAERPLPGWE